jgi:hypothetical protein
LNSNGTCLFIEGTSEWKEPPNTYLILVESCEYGKRKARSHTFELLFFPS